MLASMVTLDMPSKMRDGVYLIDRSPKNFEIILNYLRTREIPNMDQTQLEEVMIEARFYGIYSLIDELDHHLALNVEIHRPSKLMC